jgi:phosphoesterase RecJ-like protein
MSGVEEIKIWLNFTYDIFKNVIVGEFRSREIPIVDIAKKWGGGGHSLACGASISNWDDVELVIADFDNLLKEAI